MIKKVIPDDKKLTLIFRVEGGCLGPTGEDLIDDFCTKMQSTLTYAGSDYVNCILTPRISTAQPELEYQITNKKLPRDKAGKYLSIVGLAIDQLESDLLDSLTAVIERYMNRS